MEITPSYPIGRYEHKPFSEELKEKWIFDIQQLPQRIEWAIENLDEAQLQTPYRDGGWTVVQLVHHVADSHLNAYIRFKLGLTETNPTIKPYDQAAWALLPDSSLPINISITLLHSLHQRWYTILENMVNADWEKTVYHPEMKKEISLWFLLGMYAWHSRHHTAHITTLREKNNW